MPLPTLSQLPLLPASRPGDAIHSKPKHAMLVRLSSQTLDALDAFPNVQFEFGDSPALYIGDTCYPMKSSRESAIHELYLRASSATKKTAPLKLYANVVGQLDVTKELADDLRDKIRQSTQDAANQRNSRTTVLLDTPPDLSTTSRKRKEPPSSSSMFRKPLRPADKPKPVGSSSTPALPTKPPQRDKEALVPLRKRMIQCLAVSERTEEQVTRLVAGADPTASARRDVRDVLEQIAEPVAKSSSDKSPKTYCLKPASWTEARPYEWPGLNETVRTKIARTARQALRALSIPDSDPAWAHVTYRSNHSNSSDQGKSNTADKKPDIPPKRGVSSHDAKEKKAKPKADPKGDIMMKDESKPIHNRSDPPPRPNPPERRPVEPARATASDSRRADVRKANDHAGTPPARRPPSIDVKPPKPSARHEEASPAMSAAKLQRQAERAQAPSASAPTKIADDKSLTSQRIKKIRRETNGGGTSDSDRERSYAQAKVKEKEKAIKKEPVDSSRDEMRASTSTSKRKAAADYDDDDFRDAKARDGTQKRRKTEPVQPPSQRERERERERDRERDTGTKKVANVPRPAAKAVPKASASAAPSKSKTGHDSMSPPVKRSPSNTSHARYSPDSSISSNLNPSNHSHKSSSAKARRRSPIYTSCEEDETPPKTHSPAKSKPPALSLTSSQTSRDREAPSRSHHTADPATLRAKYSSLYFEYLDCYYKVDNQKTKLSNMLKNFDLGLDSDDDGDIMDDDELAQLKGKHDRLRAELVSISKSYGQIIKSGDGGLLPAPDMITA